LRSWQARLAVQTPTTTGRHPAQTTGTRRTSKSRLCQSPGQQGLAHPGTRGRRQAM
jgi:hypothetical protein